MGISIDSLDPQLDRHKRVFRKYQDMLKKRYPVIKKILLEDKDLLELSEAKDWLDVVLDYNVSTGKMIRGVALMLSFTILNTEILSAKELEELCVAAWAVEMLQGASLIADDIMDASDSRRGQPCWYKVEGVGLAGLNDAFMLESAAYVLLKRAFQRRAHYPEVVGFMQETVYKTTIGQCLDLKVTDVGSYDWKRYENLVKYKTTCYTFVGPVMINKVLLEKKNKFTEHDIKLMEEIMVEMGLLFQAQDDILDVFGDEAVTGKRGTDILDRKCTWPLVKFLDTASPPQRQLMINLFKNPEANEKKIKGLYLSAGILELFQEFEEKKRALIEMLTNNLERKHAAEIPRTLLNILMSRKK